MQNSKAIEVAMDPMQWEGTSFISKQDPLTNTSSIVQSHVTSFGDIPLFFIRQLRLVSPSKANETDTDNVVKQALLPLYLSLSDLITTWSSYVKAPNQKQDMKDIGEPDIVLLTLNQVVCEMKRDEKEGEENQLDYRHTLIIPCSGKSNKDAGLAGGGAGEGVATSGRASAASGGGGGGGNGLPPTLGDL